MQRRKFVVGLGSLAAGGSAAMSTGALTQTDIDRDLTGAVAGDTNSAYVKLSADGSSNNNGTHVDESGTQIKLDFGSTGGNGGDGLNADAISWFDRVFEVELKDHDSGTDPEDYKIYITKNFSKNSGRVTFYQNGAPGVNITGPSNARSLSGAGKRSVGLKFNLKGIQNAQSFSTLFGSDRSFTIHINYVDSNGNGPPEDPGNGNGRGN